MKKYYVKYFQNLIRKLRIWDSIRTNTKKMLQVWMLRLGWQLELEHWFYFLSFLFGINFFCKNMLQLLYFIKLVFIFHCKLLVREYTKNRITYIFNKNSVFHSKIKLYGNAYIDIITKFLSMYFFRLQKFNHNVCK